MTADDLRKALERLELSQTELARLLGVTARAVSLWATSERAIPGPVVAYLRLLSSLPTALQIHEKAYGKQEDAHMFDGMYQLLLEGKADTATGMLIISNNQVFGCDQGVNYDGICQANENQPDTALLRLKVTVPPHVELIMGQPPVNYERRFDIEFTIKAHSETRVRIGTPDGNIRGTIAFMREIPERAAA